MHCSLWILTRLSTVGRLVPMRWPFCTLLLLASRSMDHGSTPTPTPSPATRHVIVGTVAFERLICSRQ